MAYRPKAEKCSQKFNTPKNMSKGGWGSTVGRIRKVPRPSAYVHELNFLDHLPN